MRGFLHLSAVAAVALLIGGPASATVYDFSADLSSGTSTGLLTGTVDLGFVSAGGSGTGAASDLTITSYPTGVTLTPNDEPSTWPAVADNTFTVTAGAVTSFLFFSGAGPDTGQSVLCLSSGASDSVGDFSCVSDLIELHQTDGVYGYNFNGAAGITFTPTSSAPEPATWATMMVGLAATGAMLRAARRQGARRKTA